MGFNESSEYDYLFYFIKCYVKRKSGYYVWNFVMVIVRKFFMGYKYYFKVLNYLV